MLPFFLLLLAFGLDRLSKWWAVAYLAEHGPTELHPLIGLHPTYNRGIAFGLAQGIGPMVGWLSMIIVLGLLVYMVRLPRSMVLMRVGLALLIGGALGNLVDRVTAGQVFDFITTSLRPGVFNLADVLIYAGVLLAIVGALFQRQDEGSTVEAEESQQHPPGP